MLRLVFMMVFCLFISACGTPNAHYLSPKIPVTADISDMKVRDLRDQTKIAVPSDVPKSKVLGNMLGMNLALKSPRTVAETVASIVATRYPKANVDLLDCKADFTTGMWTHDMDVDISASIVSGGHGMTIHARGSNTFNLISEQNMELAYERAFEDFAQRVASMPNDTSQGVH